nr:hypothetical protein [Angustibacter aerolatus]
MTSAATSLDQGVVDAAPAPGDLTDVLAGLGELAGGGQAGCAGPGDDDEGHDISVRRWSAVR